MCVESTFSHSFGLCLLCDAARGSGLRGVCGGGAVWRVVVGAQGVSEFDVGRREGRA